jgi:hypothetical protein
MVRKSGYSKMYMVPPSIWELIKKCVNDLDMQRLEQLNVSRNIQMPATPGDRILSNISRQDINPIDASFRSRSEIGEPNVSQLEESLHIQDPSMHDSDVSRSMLEPRIEFPETTQIVQESVETPAISAEQYRQIEGPKTIVTRPAYATTSYVTNHPIVPVTSVVPVEQALQSPNVSRDYRRTSNIKFKKPLAVTFKKPYESGQRKRKASQSLNLSDTIEPTIDFPTLNPEAVASVINYPTPNVSASFGAMNMDDSNVSRMSFNPRRYSTPIPGHRLPDIQEEELPPSPIRIPILPLPQCAPKTRATRTATTSRTATTARTATNPYNLRSRTRTEPSTNPYNLRPRTRGEPTSDEGFKCSICDKKFSRKYLMEAHFKNFHGGNKKPSGFKKWK